MNNLKQEEIDDLRETVETIETLADEIETL